MPRERATAPDAVSEQEQPAAATVAAPDPTPPPGPAADTAADPVPAIPWTDWEYIGPSARTYPHVPITVFPGDVLTWPGLPADDGAWRPAEAGAVSRKPDNWRPDPGVPATDEAGRSGGLYEQGGVSNG